MNTYQFKITCFDYKVQSVFIDSDNLSDAFDILCKTYNFTDYVFINKNEKNLGYFWQISRRYNNETVMNCSCYFKTYEEAKEDLKDNVKKLNRERGVFYNYLIFENNI